MLGTPVKTTTRTDVMIQTEFVKVNTQFVGHVIKLSTHDLRTYEGRVGHAWGLVRSVRKEFEQPELASRLSKVAGRPVSQQNASNWLAGVRPRDVRLQLAFAVSLCADPGWLYFGPGYSTAKAPTVESVRAIEDDPKSFRKLPANLDRSEEEPSTIARIGKGRSASASALNPVEAKDAIGDDDYRPSKRDVIVGLWEEARSELRPRAELQALQRVLQGALDEDRLGLLPHPLKPDASTSRAKSSRRGKR